MYVFDNVSVPTEELPSTIDAPSSQPVHYTENNIRRQQPLMVTPKQLAAQDKDTFTNCPGWVNPRKQIICYQCYKIDDHISPECSAKVNGMNFVVCNYDKLPDKQKLLTLRDSYKLAKQYLEMNRALAMHTCKSDEQPRNNPKHWSRVLVLQQN